MKNKKILALSIILTSFSLSILAMEPMQIDAQNETQNTNILIVLKDGEINIPLNVAKQSPTLRIFIEEPNKTEIELREITIEIFNKIQAILYLKADSGHSDDQKSKFLKQFLKDLLKENFETFKEFLLKLKYLDCIDVIRIAIEIIEQTDTEDLSEFISEFDDCLEKSEIDKLKTKLSKKRKRDADSPNTVEGEHLVDKESEQISKRARVNTDPIEQISEKIGDRYNPILKMNVKDNQLLKRFDEIKQRLTKFEQYKSNFYTNIDTLRNLALKILLENLDLNPRNFIDNISTYPSEILKLLFKNNNINVPINSDPEFSTYLHLANSPNKVINLLNLGANPKLKDQNGKTPLMRMIERGNIPAANTLLRFSQISHTDDNQNSEDIKTFLLKQQDNNGNFPIHYAVKSGNLDLVKYMISLLKTSKDFRNLNLETPIIMAAKFNQIPILIFLKKQKAVVASKDIDGYSIFTYAIIHNIQKLFDKLCSHAYFTNEISGITKMKQTPAMLAIQHNNFYALASLISKGIAFLDKTNTFGQKAIHYAIKFDNCQAVDLLLKTGINVNEKSQKDVPLLILACCDSNQEIIETLLRFKADVNSQDSNRNTALMAAIEHKRLDIVKLLLAKEGINPNLQDTNGNTALIIAAKVNDENIMKELLSNKKVDVNKQNNNGDTALIKATLDNKPNLVKLLLERNDINPNLVNNQELNALLIACNDPNHKKEILKDLLDSTTITKINVNVKDGKDNSAMSLLIQKMDSKLTSFFKLFENKGLDLNHPINEDIMDTAARFGETKLVAEILKKAPSFNQVTALNNALYGADTEFHKETFELLLSTNNTSINHYSCVNFSDNISEFTPIRLTPLMTACCLHEREKAIELLLNNGANINCSDENATNALMWALLNPNQAPVTESMFNRVNLLVKLKELDINKRNRELKTALMLAIELINKYTDYEDTLENFVERHNIIVEIVKLLLSRTDINVNLQDINGNNAIMIAFKLYNNIAHEERLKSDDGFNEETKHLLLTLENIIQLLLDRDDIDVNLQDKNGDTLLMLAVKENNFKLVEKLLSKNNINLTLSNKEEKTAFSIANEMNFKEIQQLLANFLTKDVKDIFDQFNY